jgi:hypothetical protein
MQQAREQNENTVGATDCAGTNTQEQNVLSNASANFIVDLKEHATACNWNNIRHNVSATVELLQ